ncbi:hypothetical protein [Frateuria defendens]|uniref:hypothetical protein n=1 Tax=Frateuria defendens TaxID=2219559 RepID=UPI00066FC014|nr:hypothetical protein [Frateuria defendens]
MSPAIRHDQADAPTLLRDIATDSAYPAGHDAARPWAGGAPAPADAFLAPSIERRIADEALCRARARVLQAARRIEPDLDATLGWYHDEPIASLGRRTAENLVEAGEAERVLAFLALALRDLASVSR